jgi:hypothetical protein
VVAAKTAAAIPVLAEVDPTAAIRAADVLQVVHLLLPTVLVLLLAAQPQAALQLAAQQPAVLLHVLQRLAVLLLVLQHVLLLLVLLLQLAARQLRAAARSPAVAWVAWVACVVVDS